MKNYNKVYKSSEIYKFYSTNRNKWSDFYKSERKIISLLKFKKNSSILDIGSACGGLGVVLKKRYGIIKYTGIEINKKAHNYAKIINKNFRFYNEDLLNFEKNKKYKSKYDFVFSLGCVDWNFEIDNMLKKAWKHVKNNGFLIVTLRITDEKKKEKSYQYINFSKKLKGETAHYHVITLDDLSKKLSVLNFSKVVSYGYWGKPSKTVITKYKKIFFLALALKKNDKSNLKNFNLKNIIQLHK